MSLLEAHGYEAVFGTPEGDTYHVPLVCWREDGDHMFGMIMLKGHLRRVDALPGFMRYGTRHGGDDGTGPSFGVAPAAGCTDPERTPALR